MNRWGPGSLTVVAMLAAALASEALGQRFTTQRWTNESGLPQATVTTIAQDRAGYLWIGTLGGLVRFDGTRFERFDREPRRSQWPSRIRRIACESNGTLWIASEDRGLLCVRDQQPKRLFEDDAIDVAPLADGRVATLALGALYWVDHATGSCFEDQDYPGTTPRRAYAAGSDLVVVDNDGTFVHRGDSWHRIQVPDQDQLARPTDVVTDSDGTVWLRFPDRIARLTASRTSAETVEHLDGTGEILVRDAEDTTWFDLDGRLFRRESVVANPTLVGEVDAEGSRTHLLDRQGNLWLGGNEGLTLLAPTPLEVLEESALAIEDIGPVLPAPDGGVFLGTATGISHLKDGQLQRTFVAGLPVRALASASDGSLWACAGDTLIHLLDGHAETIEPWPDAEQPDLLRALWLDPDGTVWTGGNHGLFRIREGAVTRWTTSDGLVDDDVLCICRDFQGDLWVGTAAGATRMVAGRCHNILFEDDTARASRVRAITPSKDGTVWLATYGHGLCAWRPDATRWFTRANGLPDNHLSSVVMLPGGRLAVSTNRGLATSLYSDLQSPDRSALSWSTFAASLRRRTVEAQGGHQPAACVTNDGTLWFSVVRGLARYTEPRSVSDVEPYPCIERVETVDGSDVGDSNQLPVGVRGLTIDYTAPWFTATNEVRFKYRLVPLDDEWVDAGTGRRAHFHHLPPGHYEFQLAAVLPGHHGEPMTTSLAIGIPRYWFERGDVRLGILLAVLIFSLAYMRFRVAAAGRRSRELADLVDRRTADLNSEVEVRRRAETALRAHRDELDQRVHNRTNELRQAYERLEAETADRIRLQTSLMQSQKMDSLGLLAGGVAHDFNNLLAVINGTAELGADSNDGQAGKAFDAILRAGRTAARLTQQLLIFARQKCVDPIVQSVDEVLDESRLLLETSVGKSVDLKLEFEPDLWSVLLPSGHVEQLLINTCVNARDAMPDGGTLTITACNLPTAADRTDRHKDQEMVEILVADSGCGMSQATIERVVDPFFTTKPGGTGLGLSTCYGIARQAGGSLTIDSEIGVGTTIRILLPRHAAAADDGATEKPTRRSASVLLVDDQDDVRATLLSMLQSAGHRVSEAASGKEAIELLSDSAGSIELALIDVMMPELSGPETAKRILQLQPDVPVVFMSGSVSAREHTELLESDARVLAKPFSLDDLQSMIGDVLNGRSETKRTDRSAS